MCSGTSVESGGVEDGDRELADNICEEVRDQSPQGINYNVLLM